MSTLCYNACALAPVLVSYLSTISGVVMPKLDLPRVSLSVFQCFRLVCSSGPTAATAAHPGANTVSMGARLREAMKLEKRRGPIRDAYHPGQADSPVQPCWRRRHGSRLLWKAKCCRSSLISSRPAVEGALQHRFSQRFFAESARDKLVACCQSDKESLDTYATYLRLYAQHGYPTFGDIKQEELALQTFLWGLLPERLWEHIRLSAPRSLATSHCHIPPATDTGAAKSSRAIH